MTVLRVPETPDDLCVQLLPLSDEDSIVPELPPITNVSFPYATPKWFKFIEIELYLSILGNNLLIKSNRGGDLKTDYNQFSECLFHFCIKGLIRF
jgi:hypothetical protein